MARNLFPSRHSCEGPRLLRFLAFALGAVGAEGACSPAGLRAGGLLNHFGYAGATGAGAAAFGGVTG